MSEQTMPAAEAEGVVVDERSHYELAFHVLPTVADGEVSTVVDALKAAMADAGATLGDEEAPQRIELAYDIERALEGKHRKFSSAYFGWIRFHAPAEAIATIEEHLKDDLNILRHLLIKLSKLEEAHPVYYHELMTADGKVVETIDVAESVAPAAEATEETAVEETVTEEVATTTDEAVAATDEADDTTKA
jgi:ribosomal protein S6